MKKIGKVKSTKIAMCPRYKKKYEMEVESYTGMSTPENYKTAAVLLCPACGDYHSVDI